MESFDKRVWFCCNLMFTSATPSKLPRWSWPGVFPLSFRKTSWVVCGSVLCSMCLFVVVLCCFQLLDVCLLLHVCYVFSMFISMFLHDFAYFAQTHQAMSPHGWILVEACWSTRQMSLCVVTNAKGSGRSEEPSVGRVKCLTFASSHERSNGNHLWISAFFKFGRHQIRCLLWWSIFSIIVVASPWRWLQLEPARLTLHELVGDYLRAEWCSGW